MYKNELSGVLFSSAYLNFENQCVKLILNQMGLLAHIFPAFASHNTNYVVLFFCLNDQSEAFDFLPMLPPS